MVRGFPRRGPITGSSLPFARGLGEVAGEFLHRVIGAFGAGTIGALCRRAICSIAALSDCGVMLAGLQAPRPPRPATARSGNQHPFDSDVAVARLVGDLFGLVEHAHRVIIQSRGRSARRYR